MNKTKSTAADKSGGAAKAKQASTTSKDQGPRRRVNNKMVQNVLLIWLDTSIDEENSADCRNTVTKLRRVVNDINTFTNDEECIQFVNTIDHNNSKACMIISDSLGQHIVPRVHNMPQVDSIFIFDGNKKRHGRWVKNWPKIKGVFTEIGPMCETLKQAVKQCEHNAIPMSFIATSSDIDKKNFDQLECSFMYTQILIEILLSIKFEPKDIEEFIKYCREQFAGVKEELMNINELEKKYYSKTPIWWYTCESFLYPMLNTSVRLMDVDVIIKMGFFISDLHRHIEQSHTRQFNKHQSGKTFTVYRGQGMSTEDFEQMKNTKGGLMTFNSFLSTSTVRDVSARFARNALSNPDLVGILFIMTIDPSKSTTPFASVNDVGYFKDKADEILFSMYTVFRIRDIKSMGKNNRLYQVELILIDDNDNDLRQLTDRIREETEGSTGWDQLGELLLKTGHAEKAQQVYEILLKETTNESEKARIYRKIGWARDLQGEYIEALTFYEKSIKIGQQSLPPNHPDLAKSYNNIGNVYEELGEYSKALSYYEKDLEISQKTLHPNYINLAYSYNNIGGVYSKMGEYSKALLYYEKALEISQKSLPPDHPDLATSYNNIGNVYEELGEYPKALSYYEKDLEISEKTLPSNHLNLAYSYNNIGGVYSTMGEYSKALSYHEKALEISQKSLPPDHPDLAASYNNVGLLYNKMGDYSKALSSHEKDLEINQKSLPSNNPDLAMSYNNIGNAYKNMGEYSKAFSSYEKALEIRQQSLPPNHPDLSSSYNNIGNVYKKMGEYSKALSSYEKSLEIRQQSLPPNHPDLAKSYIAHGLVYSKMEEHAKAIEFYEQALEIQQESLPSNHSDFAMSYNNVGLVYFSMGEYSKALSSYEKALEIQEQSLPSNHPDLGSSYNNIGNVYEKMGDYSNAHSFFERAVHIGEQLLPPNHPHRQIYERNLEDVKKKLFIDIFSYNIISPAILACGRLVKNIIVHELTHSWTSNLVTNENWKPFWLNEGIESFIEAKIVGILVSDNGEAQRFHSAQRSKGLESDIIDFESANPYTCLFYRLDNVDPDEL